MDLTQVGLIRYVCRCRLLIKFLFETVALLIAGMHAWQVLFSADLRHLKVKQTCSSSSSKRAASKTASKSSKKSKK